MESSNVILQTQQISALTIELVKKTKKNEPRVFPHLLVVDKEAFGPTADSA